MRRGCLISVLVVLGLCVVGCGLAYFVGLPRFQDAIADEFEDAVSTEVARQIPATPGQGPAPGTYTITEASLLQTLQDEAEGGNVEDVLVSITPSGIEIGFDTGGGQDVSYSGGVVAENGRLVLTDFEANNEGLEFFFPADKMGEAIEDAVNNYLAVNNLQLSSVELLDGEMVLEVEAAAPDAE
jgi:hypothetical protein